jgi:hypothetical protein
MTEENPYSSPETCQQNRPINWRFAWAIGSSMGLLSAGLIMFVNMAFYTAPHTWTDWDSLGFGCFVFGSTAVNYWVATKV